MLHHLSLPNLEVVYQTLQKKLDLQFTVVDACHLRGMHYPLFPPSIPIIIYNIESREVYIALYHLVSLVYPSTHVVDMIVLGDTPYATSLPLSNWLSFSPPASESFYVYLPAIAPDTSFEAFQDVVAHLRDPNGGCPWDLKQTHLSLRQHLLEETYEVIMALDSEDTPGLCEELGDLLLQIILHIQIASESGSFRASDVLQGIHSKIVRRHPHVFGDVNISDVDGVLQNWERLKAQERALADPNASNSKKGLLDGIPSALPALTQAQEFQERALRAGISEPNGEHQSYLKFWVNQLPEDETTFGELLFSLVYRSIRSKIDAESALRLASLRFRNRLESLIQRTKLQGRHFDKLNPQELNYLWFNQPLP